MRRWRAAVGVMVVVTAILAAHPAHAGPGDVFGMGPRVMGLAGAGTALDTGPWAAHNSPAMLAFAGSGSLSMGVTGLGSQLEIGGRRQPIEDPVGFLIGWSLVREIPGRVDLAVGIGIAVHLMPGPLAHVTHHGPETPFFLAFDNRTQRAAFIPALALRIGRHVALGLSLDVFAGLEGPIGAAQGQGGDVETSLFVDVLATLRPTPSIVVRPGAGLSFSLVYHPQFSLPYSLDVSADISGLDLEMHVDGRSLASPHTLVLGAAWSRGRLSLALDLSWAMWSRLGDPFIEVETRIFRMGLLVPSNPHVPLRDTVGVRLGVEGEVLSAGRLAIVLRGGYGWESPIVGAQSGRSNIFDGHKHTAALGLTTEIGTGGQAVPRVILDLHAGVVVVSSLTHEKTVATPAEGRDDPTLIVDEDEEIPGTQISNPGWPTLTGGGWLTTMAFTVTLELR